MSARIVFTLLCLFSIQRSSAQEPDQFYGPFSSWTNVKKTYGALGDGIADDTRALQTALDNAGRNGNSPVIYFPAGVYRISRSLVLDHQINLSIIGADPANTIVRWAGEPHGTIFRLNGTAYSRFNRITWDGSGTADIAIDQSWDGKNLHFDSGNEYADNIFMDVAFGIRGGGGGHGFAETSLLRDRFIRNTSAGISLGNFNALDVWVTDCYFEDCATGITNVFGAGNFKVYNCLFRRSSRSDISMANTGEFSIRGNNSVGSATFFEAAFTRNPCPTIIIDNTIVETKKALAVDIRNQGPILLLRNSFRSLDHADGPVVHLPPGSFCSGNIFTVPEAIDSGSGSILRDNTTQPKAQQSAPTIPHLPKPHPLVRTFVNEIPVGANATAIQAIIDQAVRKKREIILLHFSFGSYPLEKSLIIPSGSNLALIGDGMGQEHASFLVRAPGNTGPLLVVNGPCRLVLNDLTFNGAESGTNLLIKKADQPASVLDLQEFHQINGRTGLLVNNQAHLQVTARDVAFSGLQTAVQVKSDRGGNSQVSILSGAGSNNHLSYKLSGAARLRVLDSWYEGSTPGTFADISGNSSFMAQGNHIATPPGKTAITIHDFYGRATIATSTLTGNISFDPGATGQVTILGLLAEEQSFVTGSQIQKSKPIQLLNRARNHKSTLLQGGSIVLEDTPGKSPVLFPDPPQTSSNSRTALAGRTVIQLHRVMSINGSVGIDIEPGDD